MSNDGQMIILTWLRDGKLYCIYMKILTMQQQEKCVDFQAMSSKNTQTNQDFKVYYEKIV